MAPGKTPKAAEVSRFGKARERPQDGARTSRDSGSPRSIPPEEGDFPPQILSASSPASGLQLQSLLQDLRTTIQEDFRAITANLHQEIRDLGERADALETKTDELCLAHNDLVDAYKELKSTHESLLLKVTDLEDRSRRNNIRVRGIPETIKPGDLTAYMRTLMRTLLPGKLDTELQLDRIHRIPKPRHLDQTVPRDVLMRVHFFRIKESLLSAMRTATTLPPPYADLLFFPDLSATTMSKRKEFLPVTKILRNHQIQYRWGFPLKLLVTRDGELTVLRNVGDGLAALQTWNLMGEFTPP
uniref:Uncharacterized protein n=1 Tax=Leptobrachium leishanense TaxID=445787 RepID=A0A8C5M2A8_9ANUR